MSRHRHIRQQVAEYYDDEEDDYYEEEDEETHEVESDQEDLHTKIATVQSMLPDASYSSIAHALHTWGGDVESAVDYLLNVKAGQSIVPCPMPTAYASTINSKSNSLQSCCYVWEAVVMADERMDIWLNEIKSSTKRIKSRPKATIPAVNMSIVSPVALIPKTMNVATHGTSPSFLSSKASFASSTLTSLSTSTPSHAPSAPPTLSHAPSFMTKSSSVRPSFASQSAKIPSFLSSSSSLKPSSSISRHVIPPASIQDAPLPSFTGSSSLFQSALLAMSGHAIQVDVPSIDHIFTSKPVAPENKESPTLSKTTYGHLVSSVDSTTQTCTVLDASEFATDFLCDKAHVGTGKEQVTDAMEVDVCFSFTHLDISSLKRPFGSIQFITDDVATRKTAKVVDKRKDYKERFQFDTPSPDDVVRQARERGKDAASHLKAAKSAVSLPPKLSDIEAKVHTLSLTHELGKPKTLTISSSHPSMLRSTSDSCATPPLPHAKGAVANHKAVAMLRTSSQPTSTSTLASTSSLSKRSLANINVQEEYQKRMDSGQKPGLNLVVVGHVDAGKSTTMGHLLHLLGNVNERTLRKYEMDSEKLKKSSFSFAWVLDETDAERERGITMDIAVNSFETPHRLLTLLDAPGHKDFIPNMISGAAQADAAILVIDSRPGEFETGFDQGGQTREHALLLRSLGVSQLIVAINKLETCNWSASRFDEIVSSLEPFLLQAGFKKSTLFYIPCSGFTGENLISKKEPALLEWYKGATLIEQIDRFQVPPRPVSKPLRMSVADCFKGGFGGAGRGGGVSVRGRIESGTIQVHEHVLLMPVNEVGIVKAIEVNNQLEKWAVAGDSVMMSLSNVDETHVHLGTVVCALDSPIPVTRHFKAHIVTFDLGRPLVGDDLVMIQGSFQEECKLTKLIAILDKSTGQVIKKNPRFLTRHVTALVEIQLKTPVCLEAYKDFKEFARFLLRLGGKTVAAGMVQEILSFEKVSSGQKM